MLSVPFEHTMTPATAVVLAMYATWLLGSLYRPLWLAIRRRLPHVGVAFGRLTFRLFEVSPVDRQVFFRDRPSDGLPGRWRPVFSVPRRSWTHLFWNPHFWLQYSVRIEIRTLEHLADTLEPAELRDTTAYRLLRNYVSTLPRDAKSRARQFVVVRGDLHDQTARAHLRSPFHDL